MALWSLFINFPLCRLPFCTFDALIAFNSTFTFPFVLVFALISFSFSCSSLPSYVILLPRSPLLSPLYLHVFLCSFSLFALSHALPIPPLPPFSPSPSSPLHASRADLANTNMTKCPPSHLTHSQSSHSPSLQADFLIPLTSTLTHLGISSGSHLLLHTSLPLHPSILQQAGRRQARVQNNRDRVMERSVLRVRKNLSATCGIILFVWP